jgi:hypothetical protein
LEEFVVSRNSSEATKATALPSSVRENSLIVYSQRIDVYGPRKNKKKTEVSLNPISTI